MGKTRRPASRVRELPTEILALIAEQVGITRDMETLRSLLNTSSAFAEVSRRELYRHIDFRGKSLDGAAAFFLPFIAPKFGHYVLSVAHLPPPDLLEHYIDEEPHWRDYLIPYTGGADFTIPNKPEVIWPRILGKLPNVVTLNLTLPTLDSEFMHAETLRSIKSWKSLKHVTLRSQSWGRGDEAGDDLTDGAASLQGAVRVLKRCSNVETIRLLGVRSPLPVDVLISQLVALRFPRLKALHIAGHRIEPLVAAASKWELNELTHLVIAEDDTLPGLRLVDLLQTLKSTLRSLAIRQAGDLTWLPHQGAAAPDYFHRLERLAVCLNHGLAEAVLPLSLLQTVSTVELGCSDPLAGRRVADLLKGGGASPGTTTKKVSTWNGLKRLTFTSSNVEQEEWEELYGVCATRGIVVEQGFDTESDFPPTWA